MIESTENIARLLKSIWVDNGIVSSAAFNLRPHIHETYISVLRESVESFADDAHQVSKDSPVCYVSINVGDLSALQVDSVSDEIEFEALDIDNERLKSHAGIFISINGQRIVGGYPFESLELQRGKSVDDVLLDIRKSLAKLASQKICYLEDGISSSS